VYDFTTLSPQDFEHLVRDLLEAEHGWRLKSFAAGPDGGVDLKVGSGKRKIVVQCKHYARSTPAQLKKSLLAEKAKMLKERPGRYLVATSRALSRSQHDTIVAAVHPPLQSPDDLLHQYDLNVMLGRHPEVERRHFKLWLASSEVLRTIVNSGIWARSEALLEDIENRVRLYVPHDGYKRASAILNKEKVVIISGSPGVGKSMLAEMLLLTHWKEQWQVVQVGSDIEDAWKAWVPKSKQIFLYDDFLGQTNAGERLSKNEDASIAKFANLVSTRADKRLILTTRTQVLRQAQESREPLRRAAFDLRTCVVKLSDYDRQNRARIVYNHLYFSGLPRPVVRDYVSQECFWAALDHPNFSPRIVEQILRRPHGTAKGLAFELAQSLDRPVELWGPSFEHGLSDLARDLLLALVTFEPEGARRSDLLEACVTKAPSLPTNQALRALEGTWVRLSGTGAQLTVSFADPSCRDYVLAYLDGDPGEAVRLMVETRSVDQAMLLLRYATSGTWRNRRMHADHPGIRDAMTSAASSIRDHLASLYSDAADSAQDFGTLERVLIAVLSAAELLGRQVTAWVDERITELPNLSPHSHAHDFEALTKLVLHASAALDAVTEMSSERGERLENAITELGLMLAEATETEEDFDAYQRVAAEAGHLFDGHHQQTIKYRATEYIRESLAELGSDYEDPDDMRDRVADLKQLADTHAATSLLEGDFLAAASMIDEMDKYEPGKDMSPTSTGEPLAGPRSRPVSDKDGDARRRQIESIREMFLTLS